MSNCVLEVLVLFNGKERINYSKELRRQFINFSNLKIFCGENHGFGAGHNFLIKKARGEKLLICNPDVEFDENGIDRLSEEFSLSTFDLVGPVLMDSTGESYPSIRRLPRFFDHVFRFANLDPFGYANKPSFVEGWARGEFLSGAVWLIRKDLFLRAGGFDERYFLYMEDIDFCRKLKSMNCRVGVSSAVVCTHQHGDGGRKSIRLFTIFVTSILKYYVKGRSLL